MPAFFLVFIRFYRAIRDGLKEPEFRALFMTVLVVLGTGTVYYHQAEGWSWVDALYFTVVTLTTIGYGDLHPTTPASKIFTIFFIFVGLGIISTFIVLLAERTTKATKNGKKTEQ
ncbi:MAG: two pore domain potassium channel family protein [Anaerolineales bacterium]|nr:two pore domain potassium channel family protein [Anaerolineales bacterium]